MKLLGLVLLAVIASAHAIPTVGRDVWHSLSEDKTVDLLISFKNTNLEAIREQALAKSTSGRTARIQSLYNGLKSHSDTAQASVLNLLQENKSSFTQLWITNQIAVRNAEEKVIRGLLKNPHISQIEKDFSVPLSQSTVLQEEQPGAGEQWNVQAVKAPEVWAQGHRGQGAVIALIDTGVRYTHEALRDGYRADHGWMDPVSDTTEPTDGQGQGTVLAGIIAGRTNGIGVAPEAQWIACRGCGSASCSVSALLACGQWALCPTRSNGSDPRCDLAPSAINSGWGGGSGNNFYDEVLRSWKEAGIIALFGVGGSGQGCGTVSSPGDSPSVVATAALTASNQVSSFSGTGPIDGRIKPDIAAPGASVTSASSASDTGYQTLSGTSLATPHVSGVIALVKSANPGASSDEIKAAIFAGAQPTVPTNRNCGGIPETTYPNNHVGHGAVNAEEALKHL